MKNPVWIDSDAGIDDAMALILATKLDTVELVSASAVAGNAPLPMTFRNVRNVLALAGRKDVKVYPGAEKPWLIPLNAAPDAHGPDGLGGAVIPESDAPAETKHAWDALYEAACAHPHELRIVAVGPLTNIANTIVKYPAFSSLIKEIAIMGGAIIGGNRTQAAEFNIIADPHAAQCVFKSGIPVVMFGLDVTHQMKLTKEDLDEIGSYGRPWSRLIVEANAYIMPLFIRNGYGPIIFLHDSCPVMYLQYPEFFEGKLAGVNVETRSGPAFGKTVSDLYVYADQLPLKNVMVMLKGDGEAMARKVKELLKN
ncbi:MAG: nucleoside hydrolase [Solobacterium sp.]|nr:nucleoside hydrolase [Solobacterium sp.]